MKVNDEELRRLVERTDAELNALYNRWKTNFREPKCVDDFVFTEDEKKAWSRAEPDFTKPIVKHLDRN
jgi:hypothetical protein